MLSVGVDVQRLGLMAVAGQPKNTAEYIQATSRVGRRHPGSSCTVLNWARPRDLSHYERFEHYHATFYQHVEALSVTPFAARALDRGLDRQLVSLLRLEQEPLDTEPRRGELDRDAGYVDAGDRGDHDARLERERRGGDEGSGREDARGTTRPVGARGRRARAGLSGTARTGRSCPLLQSPGARTGSRSPCSTPFAMSSRTSPFSPSSTAIDLRTGVDVRHARRRMRREFSPFGSVICDRASSSGHSAWAPSSTFRTSPSSSGLDDWNENQCMPIGEDRLLAAVRTRSGRRSRSFARHPCRPSRIAVTTRSATMRASAYRSAVPAVAAVPLCQARARSVPACSSSRRPLPDRIGTGTSMRRVRRQQTGRRPRCRRASSSPARTVTSTTSRGGTSCTAGTVQREPRVLRIKALARDPQPVRDAPAVDSPALDDRRFRRGRPAPLPLCRVIIPHLGAFERRVRSSGCGRCCSARRTAGSPRP